MSRKWKSSLLVLCLSLLLVACKGEEPQPQVVSKKRVVKHAAKPESVRLESPAEEEVPVEVAVIERNPFKPFVFAKPSEIFEPKTPLQRYSIAQLRLTAIIWGIKQPVGMVEAPDGKGYVVKKGDLIGNKNGRVVQVKKSSIVILERHKDHTGRVKLNKTSIKLPSSKEG